LLHNWQRFFVAPCIQVGLSEIPIGFALEHGGSLGAGCTACSLSVSVRRTAHRCAGRWGPLTRPAATLSPSEGERDRVRGLVGRQKRSPTCHARHFRRFAKGLDQHAPLHVVADGQAEPSQHRRGNIQHRRPEYQRVISEARTAGGEDAIRRLPGVIVPAANLGRRSAGAARPVRRDHHDSGLFAGGLD